MRTYPFLSNYLQSSGWELVSSHEKWGFQTGILLNSDKLAYYSTLKDTLFCLAIGRSSLPRRKGTFSRHLTLQDGVGK